MTNQASLAQVFDAAQVRLAELGDLLDAQLADGRDPRATAYSLFDLHAGLEELARRPLGGAEADIISAHLIETYGLLAVGTDPFLRPWLPPIPATGARVRRRVLRVNGGALLRLNGRLLAVGADLVPAPTSPPVLP